MSNKKTDWQIIRGLADYICGLGDFSHDTYERKNYTLRMYTSDGFVSCEMTEDGKCVSRLSVYETSMHLQLDDKNPNLKDIVEGFDPRALSKLWRSRLKFLETDANNRILEGKKRLKEELEEKLKAVEEELKGGKD